MRRGYSLIEMIVVMTAGAVLLGIATTLLCALLRAEGTGRTHFERSATLARLADQFRRDVHAADQAAEGVLWPEDAEGITLRLPPPQGEPDGRIHSVEYLVEEGEIARMEMVGDELAGEESYDLGEESSAKIEVLAAGGRKMVCLTITPKDASLRSRQLRIEAALGWDHRFAGRRAGSK